MDIPLSNEFEPLEVGLDNSQIDEEEEEEQLERNKRLSEQLEKGFDDLSSIESEIDDRYSDDLPEINTRHLTPNIRARQPASTSTPVLQNLSNLSRQKQQHKPLLIHDDQVLYRPKLNNNDIENNDHLLKEKSEEVEQLKSELSKVRGELDYFKKQSTESSGIKTKLQEALSDANHYKKENAKLSKSVEALKEHNSELTAQVAQWRQQCMDLNKRPSPKAHKDKGELKQANSRIEELESDNRTLARRVAQLRVELADALATRIQPQQQLIHLPPQIDLSNYVPKAEVRESIRRAIEKSQAEAEKKRAAAISEAKDSWHNELQSEINKLVFLVENFFETAASPPKNEIEAMLMPLRKLWVVIYESISTKNDLLNEKMEKITEAKFEMEEARVQLNEAVNVSRSESISQPALDEIRQDLEHYKKELAEYKLKLRDYRNRYYAKCDEYNQELEEARNEIAKAIKKRSTCSKCRRET